MRRTAVVYALGKLMQVMGAALVLPLLIAVWDARGAGFPAIFSAVDVYGLAISAVVGLLAGTILARLASHGRDRQGLREGYVIVTFGWLSLALIGCLPLFFYFAVVRGVEGFGPWLLAFTDAYFEIMSGFTTTGATILANIEEVPRSLLFLRSLTHWLGGMGIITLAIVIFPAMGISAYSMYRGEVPGPTHDKLRPRLAQTAQVLWAVYGSLTALETVLLMVAGMNWFDAVNHAFATMATGGFSTKSASIAAYDSAFVEWIIIVFMFLAGVNFLIHFKTFRGDFSGVTRDREFRFYTYVIVVAVLIGATMLALQGPAPMEVAAHEYRHGERPEAQFAEHYAREEAKVRSAGDCIRAAAFQVVSITTTTGFVTADFDIWPDFLRFMLVLLMFFGGCAGSTGGGIKMIRMLVAAKASVIQLRKLTQPRLVAPVKVGGQPIDNDKITNILSFLILFAGLFVGIGALMTLFVPDLTTAFTASIATLGNVGPGLAGVGAIENYGWIPIPGKWLLVLSMLLGRLEVFTVLIVLRPAIWRR